MLTSFIVFIVLVGFISAGICFGRSPGNRVERPQAENSANVLILNEISTSLDRRLQADQRKRRTINHLRTLDREWT